MPQIMADPHYDVPLIIMPGMVVHGNVYTYLSKQLGRPDDDKNWHLVPASYIRDEATVIEVEFTELAVLEKFFEQIHAARESQEQPDDCVDPDNGDGVSDIADADL